MSEPFDQHDLLQRYATNDRDTPHLRVNFVASLDGAATKDGVSGGLNNEADHQVFHTLRMLCDVLLVAAGTVRAEGYEDLRVTDDQSAWRTANGLPAHPVMAVVSASLDLDPQAPLFTKAPVRPLVFTTDTADVERRALLQPVADVVSAGEREVDPAAVISHLRDLGLPQILCEGGPRWFGTLIAAGLVDEMCLTLSPTLEGGNASRIAHGGPAPGTDMELASVLRHRDTLLLRYLRRRR